MEEEIRKAVGCSHKHITGSPELAILTGVVDLWLERFCGPNEDLE